MSRTIFLLSPASTSGKRASILLREEAKFPLAARLREAGAPLGEVFSFLSGLYFRGKLAYSERFAAPPSDVAGQYVITSSRGLRQPGEIVDTEILSCFSRVSIDISEPRYLDPLLNSAREIKARLDGRCRVVLLGSIATPKYVEPLLDVFGDSLLFPTEFIGRGDMSRGGLMLRAVKSSCELDYRAIGAVTVRNGKRPPKLGPIARTSTS